MKFLYPTIEEILQKHLPQEQVERTIYTKFIKSNKSFVGSGQIKDPLNNKSFATFSKSILIGTPISKKFPYTVTLTQGYVIIDERRNMNIIIDFLITLCLSLIVIGIAWLLGSTLQTMVALAIMGALTCAFLPIKKHINNMNNIRFLKRSIVNIEEDETKMTLNIKQQVSDVGASKNLNQIKFSILAPEKWVKIKSGSIGEEVIELEKR